MQPAFSKVLSASYLTGAALGLPSALFSSVFPETRAVRLRNAAGQDWEGKVSVRLNREAMRVEVTSGWGMFAKANGLRAGEEVRIEFLPKDVLLVTVVNPAGAASGTTARAVTPAASQRGAQHSSSDGLAALAAAAAAGVSPNTQTAEQPPHSGHHKRSAPELEAAAQQDAQQNAQQEGQQEELRELEHQAYEGQQRTPKRQRQRSDPVALVAVAAAAAAAAHDAANAAAAAALVAANAAEQAAVAAAAAAAALGQG